MNLGHRGTEILRAVTPKEPELNQARNLRVTRTYSQPPVPFATQLPVGQLYWPDSYMTPNYGPWSRYQSYGSGYGRGPYGSSFYGGYYKGFLLGY